MEEKLTDLQKKKPFEKITIIRNREKRKINGPKFEKERKGGKEVCER